MSWLSSHHLLIDLKARAKRQRQSYRRTPKGIILVGIRAVLSFSDIVTSHALTVSNRLAGFGYGNNFFRHLTRDLSIEGNGHFPIQNS
jgi:hypothetical protein